MNLNIHKESIEEIKDYISKEFSNLSDFIDLSNDDVVVNIFIMHQLKLIKKNEEC